MKVRPGLQVAVLVCKKGFLVKLIVAMELMATHKLINICVALAFVHDFLVLPICRDKDVHTLINT